LCERGVEIFNDFPPDHDSGDVELDKEEPTTPDPELEPLQPDSMVSIKEVSRRTGISKSTIKSHGESRTFPQAHASKRTPHRMVGQGHRRIGTAARRTEACASAVTGLPKPNRTARLGVQSLGAPARRSEAPAPAVTGTISLWFFGDCVTPNRALHSPVCMNSLDTD